MNAHTQMAICGPSRASFLTSLRPNTLKVYNLQTNTLGKKFLKAKHSSKQLLVLPQIFKMNGYLTYGIGKIFQENEAILMGSSDLWTEPMYSWVRKLPRPPVFTKPYQGSWIQFPDVSDTFFADGQAAQLASSLLFELLAPINQTVKQPFFLAVSRLSNFNQSMGELTLYRLDCGR